MTFTRQRFGCISEWTISNINIPSKIDYTCIIIELTFK